MEDFCPDGTDLFEPQRLFFFLRSSDGDETPVWHWRRRLATGGGVSGLDLRQLAAVVWLEPLPLRRGPSDFFLPHHLG